MWDCVLIRLVAARTILKVFLRRCNEKDILNLVDLFLSDFVKSFDPITDFYAGFIQMIIFNLRFIQYFLTIYYFEFYDFTKNIGTERSTKIKNHSIFIIAVSAVASLILIQSAICPFGANFERK